MAALTSEHRRRQTLNLQARGAWTYPHREELKRRGFIWDGSFWLAPSAEVLLRTAEELQDAPVQREWSLTVHGDAGWKDGVGRWAWFCRTHMPPKIVEGYQQGPCQNVNIAEARALLWGVRAAFDTWSPPESGQGILFLRSDSKNVVDDLLAKKRRMADIAALLDLVPQTMVLNIKHVPGHGKAGGTAAWVNQRVDRASNLRGFTGRKRLKGK